MHDTRGPGIYPTHLTFSRSAARRALERATYGDVARGGNYDAHADGAISIWARPWSRGANGGADELVGTIFWDRGSSDDEVVVFALQVGPTATLADVYGRLDALFGHPLPVSAVA
jgi:hypothetical protein